MKKHLLLFFLVNGLNYNIKSNNYIMPTVFLLSVSAVATFYKDHIKSEEKLQKILLGTKSLIDKNLKGLFFIKKYNNTILVLNARFLK